jgi:serine/threonine protein kinase
MTVPSAVRSGARGVVLGQRINNFSIVRLLGEGGMGTVYEAEHALIRKKIAVKVLKPELSADRALVQRFFNEARATSQIRHPNIVEIIDVGMLADNVPYLVMELLEGESLSDRLQRVGTLDIALAAEFARQAASGLQAAHDNGIIHRDLKPENVFLVRDQRFGDRELVKVLDFGIAKLHGQLAAPVSDTLAGVVFGTPPYMSPEQCRGLPAEVDERTDVYSLGVILYEMVCGQPPFMAEGLGELMMLHMTSEPARPSQLRPDLPSQLERVILQALQKRPEDRLTSMAEFELELTAVAASAMGQAELGGLRTRSLRGFAANGGGYSSSSSVSFAPEEPAFISVAPTHLVTTSRASGYTRRQMRSDPSFTSAPRDSAPAQLPPLAELMVTGDPTKPAAEPNPPRQTGTNVRVEPPPELPPDEEFEIEVVEEELLDEPQRRDGRRYLPLMAAMFACASLAWLAGELFDFGSLLRRATRTAAPPPLTAEASDSEPETVARHGGASRTGAPEPLPAETASHGGEMLPEPQPEAATAPAWEETHVFAATAATAEFNVIPDPDDSDVPLSPLADAPELSESPPALPPSPSLAPDAETAPPARRGRPAPEIPPSHRSAAPSAARIVDIERGLSVPLTPDDPEPSAQLSATPLTAGRRPAQLHTSRLTATRKGKSAPTSVRAKSTNAESERVVSELARRAPPANPYERPRDNEPASAPAQPGVLRPTAAEQGRADSKSGAGLGYLSLDSAPWSEVFLGNQRLGTTPLIRVPLPAGKHMLTLKNSELNASTSYQVEIESGKTVSRMVGWDSR